MKEVTSKTPTERVPLSFDFADQLAAGETITGTPTLTIHDTRGLDSVNPLSFATSGSVAINGSIVQQLVTGGKLGEIYQVTCSASTNNNQILELAVLLAIRDIADT